MAHDDAETSTCGIEECRLELDVVRASVQHLDGVLDNLEETLQSSRRVGMAIGIVMARHHATESEAVELLGRAAGRSESRLRALADEVVAARALPTT